MSSKPRERRPVSKGRDLRVGCVLIAACLSFLVAAPVHAGDNTVRFSVWGNYHLDASASLSLDSGIFQVAGNFDIAINSPSRFNMVNATLQIIGLPNAGPYSIEAMAEDIGFCDLTLPDSNLYSFKRLWIGPTTVTARLADNYDNAPGVGNEAVYAQRLVFEPGTTLDVRGLNLYYQVLSPANAGQPGSGVTITDSVGGGGIWALGTDSPVTPTNSHTNDNELCVGESTQLFADANPGLVVDWYSGQCGIDPSNHPLGTFIGTGNPRTVSPTVTTTYYAQSRNPTTGCISRICDAGVTIIVHDNPLCTITADAVVCTGASELSATVQNAGLNTMYAWTVNGGTITSGQNTDTIHFLADDVGTIVIEVTVTKTWSQGNGSVCDTTCQTTLITDRYVWTGADGDPFTDSSNWDLNIVPGSVPPGGDAIITNTGASNNTCVLDDPGGSHVMCNVKVRGTGAGKQIVQINKDSTLTTTVATSIFTNGEIALRDGTLAGGPVSNMSNTLSGYGKVTANLINTGLVQTSPLRLLQLLGASSSNQAGGTIRAVLGSGLLIESPAVSQSGTIEVQTNATVVYSTALTNSSGGNITLYNGSIGAPSLTNAVGGLIYGFGTIQCSVQNNGTITSIADAQVVGNMTNNGTIIIQNGLLTITGSLTGSGTMIGGFGGRDGESDAGLVVHGDFDVSVTDAHSLDLSHATLRLSGTAGAVQSLELLAADAGARVTLPAASLRSIGTLHVGPDATTVRLIDRHDNAPGSAAEVLYVRHLQLDPGTTIDLAGRRLYYETVTPQTPQSHGSGVHVVDSVGGGRLQSIRDARAWRERAATGQPGSNFQNPLPSP